MATEVLKSDGDLAREIQKDVLTKLTNCGIKQAFLDVRKKT
jgi:hypothetical protein